MLRQASSRAINASIQAGAQTPFLRTFQIQYPAPFVTANTTTAHLKTARWYSNKSKPAEAATGEGTKTDGKEEQAAAAAVSDDPKTGLQKEIDNKNKELLDWKDRYLRSVADFRNLQDRQTREMKSARDFAIQRFAKDLVESVDHLDFALAGVPEEKLKPAEKAEHLKDLVNLYEGIRMTETILLQTLKKHGLERYDPHGNAFNPNEHEATFMAPHADKVHNTVFHTQQKGFKLHGRVLRPAKVGVVSNK